MAKKHKKLIPNYVYLLALVLAFIFTLPILLSGKNLGIQDWDYYIGFFESARRSILVYHQFPLWDPYHCGGAPLFGNAQSAIVSLNFIFVLLFGSVVGIKISVFVHYVVGFLGFFILVKKYFSVSSTTAFLGSIIFTFSGVVSSALGTGMVPFLSFFYIPYVFYFFLKATEEKTLKNAFFSGIFLSISFYTGYHIVFWFLPILTFYPALLSLRTRSLKPILVSILMFSFFLFISFPKLYGSLEFIHDHPRPLQDLSGYKLQQLPNFLFNKIQTYHPKELKDGYFPLGVDEQSLYLGVIPFILFLIGLFYLKGRWELVGLLLFSLWLMLGINIKPSIWEHLKAFSLYSNARVAQRFRYPFILFVSLISTLGIEGLLDRIRKFLKIKKIIFLIMILVFVDLALFSHSNFFSKTFVLNNDEWTINHIQGEFHNQLYIGPAGGNHYVEGFPDSLKDTFAYVPYSSKYVGVRNNVGLITCAESVESVVSGNVKGNGEAGYRGEAYFENGDRIVKYLYWSPNKLFLFASDGASGRLIVNQNYDDNWSVKVGGKMYEAQSYDRLLSFELDGGAQEIEFIYRFIPLKDY